MSKKKTQTDVDETLCPHCGTVLLVDDGPILATKYLTCKKAKCIALTLPGNTAKDMGMFRPGYATGRANAKKWITSGNFEEFNPYQNFIMNEPYKSIASKGTLEEMPFPYIGQKYVSENENYAKKTPWNTPDFWDKEYLITKEDDEYSITKPVDFKPKMVKTSWAVAAAKDLESVSNIDGEGAIAGLLADELLANTTVSAQKAVAELLANPGGESESVILAKLKEILGDPDFKPAPSPLLQPEYKPVAKIWLKKSKAEPESNLPTTIHQGKRVIE